MEEEIIEIPLPTSSFTEISNLREVALMLFSEREDKKFIYNCPVAPTKCSFDLRPVVNRAAAKYVVLLTPTLRGSQFSPQENHVPLHPHNQMIPMNMPTSFIVWNTRGANNDSFKRNLRDLIYTHTPFMVALLEIEMENHANFRDEFHFDDIMEVGTCTRKSGWYFSPVSN